MLAGYPVEDVRVELVDGSYHDVDSSEAAFKVAGSMAVKAALKKAAPVILEPMMAVEVETPEEYMGDVMGNLSSRRGQIQGMGDRGNAKTIKAKVPLSEMFGYATDLRSTDAGPRFVHDAVRFVRGSAEERGGGNYQQGRRQRLGRAREHNGGKVSG